jgi:hypothetical protein
MDSRTEEGPIGLAFAALGHLILNSHLMYTLLGYVLRSLLGAERVRLTENSSLPAAAWFQANGAGHWCIRCTALGLPGPIHVLPSETSLTATSLKAEMGCGGSVTPKLHCPIFFMQEALSTARGASMRVATQSTVGIVRGSMI